MAYRSYPTVIVLLLHRYGRSGFQGGMGADQSASSVEPSQFNEGFQADAVTVMSPPGLAAVRPHSSTELWPKSVARDGAVPPSLTAVAGSFCWGNADADVCVAGLDKS